MTTPKSATPLEEVTVTVAAGQREVFLKLWQDFTSGNLQAGATVVGFAGMGYSDAVRAVSRDESTTYRLRQRIAEDAQRDVVDTLRDAEVLHSLQSKRFNEAVSEPQAAVEAPNDRIEHRGIDALKRLYPIACRDTGQSRRVAMFLLGLYNGERFPFDLTDLRAIDVELFEDCMAVLLMDVNVRRREVHTYFDRGNDKFEALAEDWRTPDVFRLKCIARELMRGGLANFGAGIQGGDVKGLVDAVREAMNRGDVDLN